MRPAIRGTSQAADSQLLLVDFDDAAPVGSGVPDHWTLEGLHRPDLFHVKFVAPIFDEITGFTPDRMRALPAFASKWELVSSPRKLLSCWKVVWQEVRKADVVLSNVPGGAAIMACLAARLLRKPQVVIVHGDLRARLPLYFHGPLGAPTRAVLGRLYTLFERALVSGVPTLVVSFELAARYRSVRTVRLGAYSSVRSSDITFRPSAPRAGPVRLLFAGSLELYKGIDILLEALPNLRSVNYELNICGKGPLEPLCLEAASNYSQVHLLGHVDHDRILKLCEDSDIVVVPARPGDGIPRIILEAWAKGCAVIASDTVPIRRLCGDDSAVLIPSGSPIKLAAAIVDTVENPLLRDSLTRAGYSRVKPMTIEATLETITSLLRTAIGGRVRPDKAARSHRAGRMGQK